MGPQIIAKVLNPVIPFWPYVNSKNSHRHAIRSHLWKCISRWCRRDVTLTYDQPLKGVGWAYNTINLANTVNDEKIAKLTFKNSVITVVVAVINSYRALVEDIIIWPSKSE